MSHYRSMGIPATLDEAIDVIQSMQEFLQREQLVEGSRDGQKAVGGSASRQVILTKPVGGRIPLSTAPKANDIVVIAGTTIRASLLFEIKAEFAPTLPTDTLTLVSDGRRLFEVARSGQVAQSFGCPVVINEDGLACDPVLRVEGDTDPNLLYVNGITDKVGVGLAAPTEKLEVAGTLRATKVGLNVAPGTRALNVDGLTLLKGQTVMDLSEGQTDAWDVQVGGVPKLRYSTFGGVDIWEIGRSQALEIEFGSATFINSHFIPKGPSPSFDLGAAVGNQWRTLYAQQVVTSAAVTANNTQSATGDMIVMGQTDTNLLTVDASADRIGVGLALPLAKLEVRSITEQLRLSYDVTKYAKMRVSSTGELFLTTTATAGSFFVLTDTPGTGGINFRQEVGAARLHVGSGQNFFVNVAAGQSLRFAVNFTEVAIFTGTSIQFQQPTSYGLTGSTNSIQTALTISRNATGTPAAGMGSRIEWLLANSASAFINAGDASISWTTATAGSEQSKFQVRTRIGGGFNTLLVLDGDKLAFFNGTTPVVQAAALTTDIVGVAAISAVAPGTQDYVFQGPADSSIVPSFGFMNANEFNSATTLLVNLQARVAELEAALDATTGVGLIA